MLVMSISGRWNYTVFIQTKAMVDIHSRIMVCVGKICSNIGNIAQLIRDTFKTLMFDTT